MLKENRFGVQDIYLLDENKNVLLEYNNLACSSVFRLPISGLEHIYRGLKDIKDLKPTYMRQTLNVAYKTDVPGAMSFFKFLFSKDYSPFRHYLKNFTLEYDKHGNPESFICSNLDDVNIDMYVCISSACRTAFECPGSMQVFDQVLASTHDPYYSWIVANHLSVPASIQVRNFLDDVLHFSRYYQGWHSCFDGKVYNYSLLQRGLQFGTNNFTSPQDNYRMNYWFSLHQKDDILFDSSIFTKEQKKNNYKGIFQKYVKTISNLDYNKDKAVAIRSFNELQQLYKQKVAA